MKKIVFLVVFLSFVVFGCARTTHVHMRVEIPEPKKHTEQDNTYRDSQGNIRREKIFVPID